MKDIPRSEAEEFLFCDECGEFNPQYQTHRCCAGCIQSAIEAGEPLRKVKRRLPRKGTNAGKEYKRREPALATYNWDPLLSRETRQLLLICKSWVVIGVYWALAGRAKSKGECEADQEEVADEVGCTVGAVSTAYKLLEAAKLVERSIIGHQGRFSKFKVYGYRRGDSRKFAPEPPQE